MSVVEPRLAREGEDTGLAVDVGADEAGSLGSEEPRRNERKVVSNEAQTKQ